MALTRMLVGDVTAHESECRCYVGTALFLRFSNDTHSFLQVAHSSQTRNVSASTTSHPMQDHQPEITLVTASTPTTLVYQYGCRIDRDSEALADEQYRKAHTLYNALIAQIREIVQGARDYCMNVAPPEARVIERQIDALTEAFAAARADNNEPLMKTIAAQRRECWSKMKPIMAATRKTQRETLTSRFYGRIKASAGGELHTLKAAAIADGLGGDTAAATLDAALQGYQKSIATGGMPHFRRVDEVDSNILVIAAHRSGGVPVSDFTDGTFRPVAITLRGEQVRRKYHGFVYRAGPMSSKSWVSGTLEMHRPLPADAGVAQVTLKRARIGQRYRYFLQFVCVLSGATAEPVATPKKKLVAVHMGWSERDDGLTVAAICGTGEAGDATLVKLPDNVARALDNCERAQAQRDTLFNDSVTGIKAALAAMEPRIADEQLRDNVAAIRKLPTTHIAPSRLHRVIARCAALGVATEPLTRWAELDRRLWAATAFGSRKAAMARRYFYRGIAAHLARGYDCCAVTDIDLRAAAKKVDEVTGEKSDFNSKARSNRVRAALSEFRGALVQAFSSAGGVVVAAEYAPLASTCSACGHDAIIDDRADYQQQSCPSCGEHYGRKANAAANLHQLVSGVSNLADDCRLEAAEKAAVAATARVEKLKKMQEAARKKHSENSAVA